MSHLKIILFLYFLPMIISSSMPNLIHKANKSSIVLSLNPWYICKIILELALLCNYWFDTHFIVWLQNRLIFTGLEPIPYWKIMHRIVCVQNAYFLFCFWCVWRPGRIVRHTLYLTNRKASLIITFFLFHILIFLTFLI